MEDDVYLNEGTTDVIFRNGWDLGAHLEGNLRKMWISQWDFFDAWVRATWQCWWKCEVMKGYNTDGTPSRSIVNLIKKMHETNIDHQFGIICHLERGVGGKQTKNKLRELQKKGRFHWALEKKHSKYLLIGKKTRPLHQLESDPAIFSPKLRANLDHPRNSFNGW